MSKFQIPKIKSNLRLGIWNLNLWNLNINARGDNPVSKNQLKNEITFS